MKRIILPFVVLCAAFQSHGVDLHCEAGRLPELVGNPSAVTELRISGSIDASDMFFIASSMPAMLTLDLSAADIAAYSGAPLQGSTSYPAMTIPAGTFAGTGLESVAFPASAPLALGEMAFAGTPLLKVELPATTASVGIGAFAACTKLVEAKLSGVSCEGYTFRDCTALKTADLGGAVSIAPGTFYGCRNLSAVSGAGNVAEIGDYALADCPMLGEYAFSPSLRRIGEGAFCGSGIGEAVLGHTSLATIGPWAFSDNCFLTDVSLPTSASDIGHGAFFGCCGLVRLTIPDSASELSDYVLAGAGLEGFFSLPASVEKFGRYAFAGASGLTTLVLPRALTSVGDNAMAGLTSLTAIDATALEAVPATGADVWEGVEQSAVSLHVSESMKSEFEAAPQWQDFRINATGTGTADISASSSAAVSGRLDGGILEIISQSSDISLLQLYDASGVLLTSQHPGAARCLSDLSALRDGTVVIVAVALADGTSASLKFLK